VLTIKKQTILPANLKTIFADTGNVTQFTGRFFKEVFKPPYEIREFLKQCYIIGYKSLPLVGITGFIMGLVLTLQSRPTLAEFGAESWLPGMVALSLIREIAPVITALICAGKISSGIGAELGSMKVTEQIDAMEVSAINPYNYLVVTRILATTDHGSAIGGICRWHRYSGRLCRYQYPQRCQFNQVFFPGVCFT
jgi:phospholipid/cholesterol/gamma-HCH transport system permease protein